MTTHYPLSAAEADAGLRDRLLALADSMEAGAREARQARGITLAAANTGLRQKIIARLARNGGLTAHEVTRAARVALDHGHLRQARARSDG